MIIVATSRHRPDDERIYHREIRSLLEAGYNIIYFTRWELKMNLTTDNLHHMNYSEKNLTVFSYIQCIEEYLKIAFHPDVVHIHEFDLLPLAKKLKKQFNTRVVYDVHDTLRALWNTFSSHKGLVKYMINKSLSFFENRYLKYVDHVVLANIVLDKNYYLNKGLPITVIENYPRVSLPLELPKPISPPTILYHGQVSRERGILILLEAFRILHTDFPDVQLQIIGPYRYESFRNEIKQFIQNYRLNKNIVLIGKIPHREIWNYIRRAAIGVIPSLASPRTMTDTPTKLFEYMASGCAVVATDLPPVKYHSKDAFVFVKPGNADELARGIRLLLTNQTERRQRIVKAKELIETKYNWSLIEPKFFEVYKSILLP